MCSCVIYFTVLSFSRLDTRLKRIESLNSVPTRWMQNDTQYKEAEQLHLAQLKSSLLAAIHDTSVKRKFLLHVKAKYSG